MIQTIITIGMLAFLYQLFPFPGVFQIAATPAFVSEVGKNSTLTNALGTNVATQTACAAYSYCIPFSETALSGNLGVVAFQHAGSVTPTATDDQSDTWTCLTPSSADTSKILDICTSANLTSGAHLVTVTFGTTAVTQVMANLAQFTNIATSSPVRVSGSTVGTSSTTMTGPVLATNVNDMVYAYFCRTGTPLMTSGAFTPGSGFTLGAVNYQDGCASEFEVATSGGNVTPTMTMGSASTYIVYAAAFKSATAGTAPSGLRVQRMQSWSSPDGTQTTTKFQFPNASTSQLFASNVCGGSGPMSPNSMTDSGSNVWASTGAVNTLGTGSAGYVSEMQVSNSAANSTSIQTLNTTGTGDCTTMFYELTGAPASPAPFVVRGTFGAFPTTTNLIPATALTFLPNITNGFLMLAGGQSFRTSVSVAQPSSGCAFDAAFYGGMALDGPEPIDQNNIWAHCYISAPGNQSIQFNLSSSSSSTNAYGIDAIAFLSSTGIGILNSANNAATSGSSLAITVPATTAGNELVVAINIYDGATARTVTKVCTDGATCAAGNLFSQVTGAVTSNTTQGNTDIWHLDSALGGKTTVTVTASGAITGLEGAYYELQKGSTAAWAVDGSGAHVTNGTVASSTVTGAAVTPTGPADFCVATTAVSNTVTVSPKAGNAFIYVPGLIYGGSGDAASALLTTSTSAQTPTWTDASGTFNASTACFK